MKLKNNSFIMAICLFPVILVLSILKIMNILKGSFFGYLIIGMIMAFWVFFIFALFFALEEITNSKKKIRLLPLMIFPFLYLPLYYTKYVYKSEKYVGYVSVVANVLLIISLFLSVKTYVTNYMINLSNNNIAINNIYCEKL